MSSVSPPDHATGRGDQRRLRNIAGGGPREQNAQRTALLERREPALAVGMRIGDAGDPVGAFQRRGGGKTVKR